MSHSPIENRILAALPSLDREQMLAHLEPFSLNHSEVLYETGDPMQYVYFVNSGMVSMVSTTEEGNTLEVGIIGYEGVVGFVVFLGAEATRYRFVVQGTGDALRMTADKFKAACEQRSSLRGLILGYTQARMTQITQAAICNHFHSIESRLCRWLLESLSCMKSNELELTQDFLAMMLGTHRPSITIAAGILQSAGMIRYNRGHITVLNRRALEEASCECYRVIRRALNWFAEDERSL